jgi:hypothetical protein
MSENTGSVGKQTIASSAVIGAANIYATWASQVHRTMRKHTLVVNPFVIRYFEQMTAHVCFIIFIYTL